ncbi:MAG TPA: cupin domain-containing protein [Rhodanobacteraceae bacterium]|nr:cupin domain-containing protein [Rhodanobacteraceae bacterium]
MPATRPAFPIEIRASARHRLGMPPARFLRDYWQKRPLLVRNAFPDFAPPLSPDDLAGLACMEGALARIVMHAPPARRAARTPRHHNDGNWTLRSGPFDDATFAKLPERDWTLLVQDVDKWDTDTAGLLDHFDFIPSWRIDDVMISYAADRGGVGAHVDQYDVFLLQGLGQRRWSIDARPDPPTAFRDDVELKLLREFRPSHTWLLESGDMLYLPPGVPHDGVADGECTTFSIGMRAPAAGELLFDFAAHVAETLPECRRFADPDLRPAQNAGEIDADALRRARRTLGAVAAVLGDDAFADWFGTFITRYRAARVATPRTRPIDRAQLATRLAQARFHRDPWSRFAWRKRGRAARLYVAGQGFDAPIAWARELASGAREFPGQSLAKLPQAAGGIALLASLIDAGHLNLKRR